jgi:hypothetical protein
MGVNLLDEENEKTKSNYLCKVNLNRRKFYKSFISGNRCKTEKIIQILYDRVNVLIWCEDDLIEMD